MGVLDEHFVFQERIESRYREREKDPAALQDAVTACEAQISLAPQTAEAFSEEGFDTLPRHVGFQQLAVIREKQGDYAEALRVSEEARSQGWAGDWDKRVVRLRRKLEKGA
jgi:hypothetical protein